MQYDTRQDVLMQMLALEQACSVIVKLTVVPILILEMRLVSSFSSRGCFLPVNCSRIRLIPSLGASG